MAKHKNTIKDFITNIFYKIRYWFYRNFIPKKLKNYSEFKKEGYKNTFNDDFDAISWSPLKDKNWIVGEHWGKVHPKKLNMYYGEPKIVDSCGIFSVKYNPKNFKVEGNVVNIPFETSLLSSYYSFKQTYGRFECRCTLPKEKYAWPAFWMWGNPWPPEIDIFECYGRETGKDIVRQEISLHTDNGNTLKALKIKIDKYKNMTNFHEFAFEWSDKKLEFFLNGVKVCKITNKAMVNYFNTEQWLIINHGIQRHITEKDKDYYSEFKVDYIRVYEKN